MAPIGDKPVTSYSFRYDPNLLPETGAQDLFSAYNLAVNLTLDPLFEEASGWARPVAVLLQEGVALYMGGVQHEFFGHGTRTREFGCSTEHDFRLWEGKFGQIRSSNCPPNLPIVKEVMAAMGGTEATQVFSIVTGEKMKLYGGNVANAMLYLDTHLDIANYILLWDNPTTDNTFSPFDNREKFFPNSGPDVTDYWQNMSLAKYARLKEKYGPGKAYLYWDGPGFSYDHLTAGAVWNAFDPYTLYMAYQVINYVATGKERFEIPDFLPRTNFVMGPNGPEYYLTLPFTVAGTLLEPYVRTTANNSPDTNAYGTGIKVMNFPVAFSGNRFFLEGELHFWKEPQAYGAGGTMGAYTNALGRLVSNKTDNLYVGAEVNAKTEGYLLGQPLKSGLFWSLGLDYYFPAD